VFVFWDLAGERRVMEDRKVEERREKGARAKDDSDVVSLARIFAVQSVSQLVNQSVNHSSLPIYLPLVTYLASNLSTLNPITKKPT
jgi:hypothetical protein